jgi:2'-5' RNA ligase
LSKREAHFFEFGDMIRLFVALELPEELRERMAMIARGVSGAKWVPPEKLHLTLRFIGEVPEDRYDDIVYALETVDSEPFLLTITGAGHFESGRRVRALWLGVERDPALMALSRRIESALVRAGLPPEERKFVPHITLARLNDASPAQVSGWLQANNMFRAVPLPVHSFVLFSSFHSRTGSIYRPEHEFPLRRGQDPRMLEMGL